MQRRSHGDASESTAGADRALADGGAAGNGAELTAAALDSTAGAGAVLTEAAAGATDGTAGAGAEERQREEMSLIGQELVPVVSQGVTSEGNEGEKSKSERAEGHFQTPGEKKTHGSPIEQLQLQNTPWTDPNDLSSTKQKEESKTVTSVPNGPPIVYGPPSPVPPLFTQEQIAQLTDPRNASSMLPFASPILPTTLQSTMQPSLQPDLPRIPGFLQGLFPGYDHLQGLQEMRQRDLEWRQNMEAMVEHLGLQLRASQNENMRLREELHEAKFMSRYGTPEDRSLSEGRKASVGEQSQKENGVVTQQGSKAPLPKKGAIKEEGAKSRQGRPKEDGAESRQGPSKEDGAESRQAPSKEDGAETRQARPDPKAEETSSEGSGGQEDGPAGRQGPGHTPEGAQEQTMQVLLKIVQGMQSMQQRLIDTKDENREEVEYVRYSPELPKLPDWSPETAPIDYGDWIVCLHTYMSDLSTTSEEWWNQTLQVAKDWYGQHMKLTPIQRLTHSPEVTPELKARKWGRLERRAASLLMSALPEQLKEEVVSSKAVTTLGILAKAMLQYQPGGLSERSAILQALESPMESTTVPSAISQLRKWIRWKRRAVEVGVAIPDSSILMRGLGKSMKRIVMAYPDLNFRLSLVRNALLVDTVPNLESVTQYSEHVLAELEQMGHQAKKKEALLEAPPRVRKLEEGQKAEEKPRWKGKPKEEVESKKSPCKFYLTDGGCRRGRLCPYGHVLDQEKRCWNCGAKDHFAGSCPRSEATDVKPKASKAAAKSPEKDTKTTTPASEKVDDGDEGGEVSNGESMKNLLDEANKMLKTLQESDIREKRQVKENSEQRLQGLQKQLDELKKASLKPFRISKICHAGHGGLLDSGATHPLRPRRKGERVSHFPKVNVTLAGDQQVTMALSPTGVIIGDESAEPIVPMGILTSSLGCSITWNGMDLCVKHPKLGNLDIKLKDGCPMISYDLALKLIEEIEAKASVALRAFHLDGDQELEWIRRLVAEHPVFSGLPERLKEALIQKPAADVLPLGNRRRRKLWRTKGMLVHLFSGEDAGYTLGRSFHEVGGDRRLMVELDVLHQQKAADLSQEGEAYPLLLRAALNGWVRAWVGGPPCRTRSVLRHLEVPGETMPRPLRSWSGGEWGVDGLSTYEASQLFTDDLLMMRFLLLYIVSETVRRAEGSEDPTTLVLEQPAAPEDRPEVVSWWRTPEWEKLAKLYHLHEQRVDQSEFGAVPTKPTVIGGNVWLHVPLPGRKGKSRDITGMTKAEICESSRKLSRWPPMLMRSISECLQRDTMKQEVKLRALSWREHIAAGHTPFRKDCLICQQSSAKDHHHRRSKQPPRVGVLSLDLSGPFKVAPDLHSRSAKYLLVGAFTWLSKDQLADDFEELDIPEVPKDAPEIDDPEGVEDVEEAPLPALRDEDDVWGELQAQREEEDRKKREEKNEEGEEEVEKGEEEVEKGEEIEERKDPKITVTRLCTPIQSKSQHDVLRAIIDMYLRLRSDGYVVTQLHTDRGGEFMSTALDRWCTSRTILHTFTPGDQPQSNGRVEVAVQWVKAEIRRLLHAAGAPFKRWPLAARNLNERLRLRQVGKEAKIPPFLSSVLIRKRFWRTQELLPTQEAALYLGPSWIHHGHWIERSDGSFALTRMVMHQLTEPPAQLDDWIGLEDELAPTEVRRRIRGKVTLNHLALGKELPLKTGELEEEQSDEKGDESDEEREMKLRSMRRVIEQEMKHAVEDDPVAAYTTLDAVAMMKEMTCDSKVEEVLQTKIVSQQEVRRNLDQWIPPIKAELESLFNKKGALKKIDYEEVKRLLSKDEAEVLPSKLVYTLKPSPENKAGKLKARLVACGNFAEKSEVDLFASGATAVALRAAVSIAAQKRWGGKVCDIRTAFLNAPMSLEAPGGDDGDGPVQAPKKAIVKPPPLLIAAGLAEPNEHWEVCMALYGYRQSPRLWANHRDGVLPTLEIQTEEGDDLVLDQMITEPNLWKIQRKSDGHLMGLLLVYVDDLLVLGCDSVLKATIKSVQRVWEISSPETVNEADGVRFLGAELFCQPGQWWMTQSNYIQDLLVRNLGEDPETWSKRKTPLLAEPAVREDPPNKDIPHIREAQRVIGELVWVATRTRPDLALTINRLASMITKDPNQVIELVKQVWYYLANTIDHGLLFKNPPEENQLNIYTDASFGEICIGCHLVMWGSSMLLWKSGKQSVVTASTAEAELVEILEGALSGDAVRVVLEEALDRKVRAVSHSDSTAAIAIVSGDTGSWRTRHLKKRAHILRSKVNMGDWLLRHIPGSELPADLGTKVLSFEKFRGHKILMGMFLGNEKEEIENGEKKKGGKGKVEKAGENKAATVQALKAIILFAKLAQAKGERDDQVQLWANSIALQSFSDPSSGPPFFLILAMVLFIGILLGAVLAWMMIYPYMHRVTLVRSNVIPRPTFLMHPLPEENQRSRDQNAPQPRRSQATSSSAAAERSSSAAAERSSSAAAGRSSSAAAEHSSSAAAERSSGAAAGRSSSAAEAATQRAAGPVSAAAAAGTERGNGSLRLRNRQLGTLARDFPLYVSPMGQRFHSDPNCRGLRHARSVTRCPRCETCGPVQTRPVEPLFGLGPGFVLHGDQQHIQTLSNGDEIYEYQPCALCMAHT